MNLYYNIVGYSDSGNDNDYYLDTVPFQYYNKYGWCKGDFDFFGDLGVVPQEWIDNYFLKILELK